MIYRRIFHQALVFGAAVATLCLPGRANASAIPISFTTYGSFSAGTTPFISYTPTSFSGVTAPDGSLTLFDLGTFTASTVFENTDFSGFFFTLGFNFSLPDGVSGPVEFLGDLHGQLHPSGGSNVHVHFSNVNPILISYSGSSGTDSFALTMNNVRALDVGSPQTATGFIGEPVLVAEENPEPGSFLLMGTALATISWAIRRRRATAPDRETSQPAL